MDASILGRNLNDDSIVGRSEAFDRAMLIRRECVQLFLFPRDFFWFCCLAFVALLLLLERGRGLY
jgi:hypothetical protein